MSEENPNDKLTPKEVAVKNNATCGSCRFTDPAMVPLVPPSNAVVRPNTMRGLPVCVCMNPKSDHFGQMLSIIGSCALQEKRATVTVPKKIAAKIANPKGRIITGAN